MCQRSVCPGGPGGGFELFGVLCVMWDRLEFLATWVCGEGCRIPLSLPAPCQPSLGCCHPSLKGGLGGSRLGKLITQLIHPDQTGFLLGRCSADGMRKLLICQF